jgi:signal transduction histidine kinase
MADAIHQTEDRTRVLEAATMISQAGESSSRLARRLLLLGRKEQVPIERVSVRESLRLFQRVLTHSIPRGVQVSVDDSVDCDVMVPVSQLEQALLNLALNAVDAMAGQGSLSIQARERIIDTAPAGWRAQPGRFVELSISDTGSGMSEQTLARIFEPFFTTKQIGQGNGLGLAMVRTLVYDANGFIEVDSRLGQGSSFQLCLPIAASPPQP